jgi:hypothetical protein
MAKTEVIPVQFKYGDIMELGFSEEFVSDPVYFHQHGYEYSIVTKWLTKTISLDWDKTTRLCELVRIDSKKNMTIMAKMPMTSLEQMKDLINFFLS